MSDFNPGEGWREVTSPDGAELILFDRGNGSARGCWVREEPVPPLPTEYEEKIRSVEELRVGDVVTRQGTHAQWPLVQRKMTVAEVPPLPTEPRTSIAVAWKTGRTSDDEFVLRHDGDWQHLWGDGRKYRPEDLRSWITGFEVLAEPMAAMLARIREQGAQQLAEHVRRETAKAVLDQVNAHMRKHGGAVWAFADIARKFGVPS